MLKLSKYDDAALERKAREDLKRIKEWLKKEPVVVNAFERYKRDINEIDSVSIKFIKNLDVSAKTINGRIYLNAKMLQEDWKDYRSYSCHEILHYLQHSNNKCAENNPNIDYLDNPAEIEAFQAQLAVKEKTEPKKDVERYLSDLFDKHNLPKEERPEKKKELLGEE